MNALALSALVLLAACAPVTAVLDEQTRATLAERCLSYQSSLALATVLYEDLALRGVSDDRKARAKARIAGLQAATNAMCSSEALGGAAS